MNLSEAITISQALAADFSNSNFEGAFSPAFAFRAAGPSLMGRMGSIKPKRANPVNVGVGVSPGRGRNDWRVAMRAWSKQDLEDRQVERAIEHLKDAVEVRVTEPIVAFPTEATVLPNTRRQRPLVPGCSVGHYKVGAGTLGAFVRSDEGQVQMLSNNHVLANVNIASEGDVILQPGVQDGGITPTDVVGSLNKFHLLQASGNRVDAAVANVDAACLPSDFSLPVIGRLKGVFTGQLADLTGQTGQPGPLQKVGRTTDHTTGYITALGIRNLPVKYGQRTLWFDDVVEVAANDGYFSAPGDSGSLVVDMDGNAVGLLFSGTAESTYFNPILPVLEALKVTLL